MTSLQQQIQEHRQRVFAEAEKQLAAGHEFIAIPGIQGGEPVHRSVVERGLQIARDELAAYAEHNL